MPKPTNQITARRSTGGPEMIGRIRREGWIYIKSVVDVVREPVLVLDQDLRVLAANEPFYQMFQVDPGDTEGQVVYKLGNGQWDVPALRKLLEDILPKNTFFKGFEVTQDFPAIGRKSMILNARQIFLKDHLSSKLVSPIILLAIEDLTELMMVADTLAAHTNNLESKITIQTERLEKKVSELEKQIHELKKNT